MWMQYIVPKRRWNSVSESSIAYRFINLFFDREDGDSILLRNVRELRWCHIQLLLVAVHFSETSVKFCVGTDYYRSISYLAIWSWRRRQRVPLKCLWTTRSHGIIFQKIIIPIVLLLEPHTEYKLNYSRITVFWNVMWCSLVGRYQHFGGTSYPHLHGRRVS
jgi:hypothetical protein